ncbi:MAG: hypothetical protein JKY37_34125, partial [Nannocystaceae bacterium]|nr:hypothetical protein [Nannocystaceae bacterium]
EGNDADKGVSNEARDEITAVLARMHAAVSNGNPDDLVSLLREKIARQVSAVGETVVGATATQRSTIEALIEHRATLAPLRPGALQFHSVRSGQEVRVCDAEGRGPIVVALPDASISMCPSFALIDGAWVVVR